jgi:hypothetical protein
MNFAHVTIIGLLQIAMFLGSARSDDDVVPDSATKVQFDFAKWVKVADKTFTLERTTLADVTEALGAGQIVNTDASDPGNADPHWAVFYQCGNKIVRFEADGDMGGPEHRVTGVAIQAASDLTHPEKLAVLRANVVFPFGKIGMEFTDLQLKLGKAKLQKKCATYVYAGHTLIPDRKDIAGEAQTYDVTGYLSVKVEDGKIAGVSMSHITSS